MGLINKIKIGNKILLGFLLVFILMLFNSLYTSFVLFNSIGNLNEVSKEINPSLNVLNSFNSFLNDTEISVLIWVYAEKNDKNVQILNENQINLQNLHDETFKTLKKRVSGLMGNWKLDEKNLMKKILADFDTLLIDQKKIVEFMSYKDDWEKRFSAVAIVETKIIANTVILSTKLSDISTLLKKRSENANTDMLQSFKSLQRLIFILGISIIAIGIIISVFLSRKITNPINDLKSIIDLLRKGIIPDRVDILDKGKDEINQMRIAINELIKGLKSYANFATEVGNKHYETSFDKLSNSDTIGTALINMRNNLKNAYLEEDQRKKEDAYRNWITSGLTEFGDVLRQYTGNITELSFTVISKLIHYLNANQGGIFIYNDENKDDIYLELMACYAYNRRKLLKKKIKIGDGLLGTCAIELKKIHITEIPDDYINISSGMGEANPKSLIIIPFIWDEKLLGVMEIASFNDFEKHEIEFIEKVSENIASSLLSLKINIQTQKLLEKSQAQAAQLAEQEIEMRQNIEEMQAQKEDKEEFTIYE